jgi:hypothetical protein
MKIRSAVLELLHAFRRTELSSSSSFPECSMYPCVCLFYNFWIMCWINMKLCNNMKSRVFCYVAPCSLVVIDRLFRGAYCLRHQGDSSLIFILVALRTWSITVYDYPWFEVLTAVILVVVFWIAFLVDIDYWRNVSLPPLDLTFQLYYRLSWFSSASPYKCYGSTLDRLRSFPSRYFPFISLTIIHPSTIR